MSLDVTRCHTCADRLNDRPPPGEQERLSERQFLAVELLLAGKCDSDVAAAVGVSRRTILRWRLEDLDMIAELRRRRRQLRSATADRLRNLLTPAVQVLADQLNDRYDRTRFRAAMEILRLVGVRQAITDDEQE